MGNPADLSSSFDGASISPGLLRDHQQALACPAGVPSTISERAQHLQEPRSCTEGRISCKVSGERHSFAANARPSMSTDSTGSSPMYSHSEVQPESQGQSPVPSLAEGLGFAQLMSFQRGHPQGRCSCMLKRHFDERSRLSRDLGQEAALTDSDSSFADLMTTDTTSPGPLQRQISHITSQLVPEPSPTPPAHGGHEDAASVSGTTTLSNPKVASLGSQMYPEKLQLHLQPQSPCASQGKRCIDVIHVVLCILPPSWAPKRIGKTMALSN